MRGAPFSASTPPRSRPSLAMAGARSALSETSESLNEEEHPHAHSAFAGRRRLGRLAGLYLCRPSDRPGQVPLQDHRGRRALRARRWHGQPHAHDRGHHRREQVVADADQRGEPRRRQRRRRLHLPDQQEGRFPLRRGRGADHRLGQVRGTAPGQPPGRLHNGEDHIFTYLFEKAAGIKLKYVPFNSGGECTVALMGGHVDAGVMNPNEIVAQVEAKKAKNLAVAARKRLKDAPDMPTFAEKGYEFYWEQMRGVVGPAGMSPEAIKWWQDTLKKVVESRKWQEQYIKPNLLTPVVWIGEEANKYLDSLNGKYEKALGDLGAIKK